jgi:hypothetical protein
VRLVIASSGKLAPNLKQIELAGAAARLRLLSFPQVNPFVWYVGAGNVKKIQDIVVSC